MTPRLAVKPTTALLMGLLWALTVIVPTALVVWAAVPS